MSENAPTDDKWFWYSPAENTHLVREGEAATLCGMKADNDRLREAVDYKGAPVPRHEPACNRCQASFAREQLEAAEEEITMDDLEENDVVLFWTGIPTDPSYWGAIRKIGVVEELPPLQRGRKGTIDDRVAIRRDSMTLHTVKPWNIYETVDVDGDPMEALEESRLVKEVQRVFREAYNE